jgi:hypothetical protein
MLEGRKRLLLIVRKPRKEIEMDSDTKFFLVLLGILAAVLLAVLAYCMYDLRLRTEYIANASDPIAAACAYDSQEAAFPPSCVAHLYQQKEVINALQ